MAKTVIAASVIDQSMTLENLPKLASGGVNEIQVNFTFCELWAGAASKTAVFFRSKAEVYHVAMEDDSCTAPWEVFATEGTVYMGAFATYEDGTTRTCEALPLSLAQGAITTGNAPSEAPDIYAALAARVAAVEGRVAALETGSGSDGGTLTHVDLSNFSNGTWTETIDGEVINHTSVFSEDGTTVTIDGVTVKLG